MSAPMFDPVTDALAPQLAGDPHDDDPDVLESLFEIVSGPPDTSLVTEDAPDHTQHEIPRPTRIQSGFQQVDANTLSPVQILPFNPYRDRVVIRFTPGHTESGAAGSRAQTLISRRTVTGQTSITGPIIEITGNSQARIVLRVFAISGTTPSILASLLACDEQGVILGAGSTIVSTAARTTTGTTGAVATAVLLAGTRYVVGFPNWAAGSADQSIDFEVIGYFTDGNGNSDAGNATDYVLIADEANKCTVVSSTSGQAGKLPGNVDLLIEGHTGPLFIMPGQISGPGVVSWWAVSA